MNEIKFHHSARQWLFIAQIKVSIPIKSAARQTVSFLP